MKDVESVNLSNMQSAMGLEPDRFFTNTFDFARKLPENLSVLNDILRNFYWSWQPDGAEIFRELDPTLWEECEQNPILLLKTISGLRLLQKSTDRTYVQRLKSFTSKFDDYLEQGSNSFGKVTPANPAAYFCAEYGVHNSLPTYSGGLGILAGDHLKSASDLNVPLTAIGLLYRFGYFRQQIGHDGIQQEEYQDVFNSELALHPVLDEGGNRILVSVHIRGREVYAQAWLAKVGRISLYLLDTNVEQNAEVDRLITGHLYGGSTETRIVQEKVLGIGGVRLLRTLGIQPSVYHLNEGHSAFLTLELAREIIADGLSADFDDAASKVREQCVFTTHTPVSAGNDVFATDEIRACFDAGFISSLNLTEEEFFTLGRVHPENTEESFGMTPLAIKMCRSANGVSEKHGEVSRELWLQMFPEISDAANVPITHITNGVHAPTWIAPVVQELYIDLIGTNWKEKLADPTAWSKAIDRIPDAEIWTVHKTLKQILIEFLRQRTEKKETGKIDTINEHLDTQKLFSADVLTIGFARRVAAYKRWNLLLSDLERLLRLVDDPERPVQFVFAGKAHPQDDSAKRILQQLMSINNESNWQNRAIFVEDYDQEVARYLVQGVDVWMNVPRRPYEASGTSGMKAAMNGGLNFSILDGWWIEGFNGKNGFSIGELDVDPDEAIGDAEDAESLYLTLENEIIPAYYEKNEQGLPSKWIGQMKNALATLTPLFSSDRMVTDYIQQIYVPKNS